ncbi:MAG: hypothetical protein ACD_22C00100G0011 [uncultured bacterium]|nr:MAG: hypothetical protein ACD_22C00100G0011 [uncultured bacterium]
MPNFKPSVYIKDESFDPFYKSVNWVFLLRTRVLPFSFLLLGLFVFVTQVVVPVYFFKAYDEIPSPITHTVLATEVGFNTFEFTELTQTIPVDTLDNINTDDVISRPANVPEYFYLSIPALKIKNALVETNPTDLDPDKALGRYTGTSLPGEAGTMFIYGHSVLPMFYNPRNYKAIFSTLDTLKQGDEVNIMYNNVEYSYKVDGKILQAPEQVDPKAQLKPGHLNESSLVLMTCYPAGTKAKRLLITASEKN